MRLKNIHFILNPAAGREEPILSYINKAFSGSGIDWDISITKKKNDAFNMASQLVGKTDLIAAYGGDGSLTEVARALHNTKTPMAILPGGTANVMAKELGIPLDVMEALQLLKSKKTKIATIDMGLVNDHPFLLRVNLGIMADMVIQADRKLKDNFGQMAYGLSALKTLASNRPVQYDFIVDGQKISEQAVAMTITNSGNIGISDFVLHPDINVVDGYLDIVLMNEAGFLSVMEILGSTLLHVESKNLKHWKCKQLVIHAQSPQKYICDDHLKSAKTLWIRISPKSLRVLVPADSEFESSKIEKKKSKAKS